jgi:hypothetical protein
MDWRNPQETAMSRTCRPFEAPWQSVQAHADQAVGVRLGPLDLWTRQRGADLLLSSAYHPLLEDDRDIRTLEAPVPETPDWKRIGAWDDLGNLRMLPRFPDRPVLVRPQFPYTLLPGERIRFLVVVPVWVTLGREGEPPVLQQPVLKLSNTWFGTPTSGELCYAIRTLAHREGDDLDNGSWQVVCPVRIRNQSKETVSFERLCLRVKHLSIYQHPTRGLWANESSVNFRGGDSWSRVAYARKPPVDLGEMTLLCEGEEDPQGTFIQRAITQGRGFFQ